MHVRAAALEDVDPTSLATKGRWQPILTPLMSINAVHAALLRTGKVLVVAGSGAIEHNPPRAALWDPVTHDVETIDTGWDMFCNGTVILPDGRPLVFGGTAAYPPEGAPADDYAGLKKASIFRPFEKTFDDASVPDMKRGRWYPTGTVLGDGRVMVFSGQNESTVITREMEIYDPATNVWTLESPAPSKPRWYPRQHLLPSGKVFISGWQRPSLVYDPASKNWAVGPATRLEGEREYGTAVLLPFTKANGFKPEVMILGGNAGGSVQNKTELIDLSNPDHTQWRWRDGTPMTFARVQLNATILPDGKVLVSGGSAEPNARNPVLPAELYNPSTKTFRQVASLAKARLYHSNTLLLPDATVMAVGSNPNPPAFEYTVEIYSPPYLFTSTPRPTITSLPAAVKYGNTFAVQTPDAGTIDSVVLIRPGAPTHAFDMEQRLVELSYTAADGVLTVTAPAHGNLAPPGYYLLFILNNGVPSVGKFVKFSA